MKQKSILLLLIFTLSLAGCAAVPDSAPVPAANTVTDGAGVTLVIPENRQNTTIASVYAVSVPFIKALDLTERVVAINVKSKFWTDVDKHLAAAGSVGRGAVDLEALATFAPDVLLHRSNDPLTVEAVRAKLGIDVLCITVESFEDIRDTLNMMGVYFGREERSQQVIEWLDGKFALLDEIVAGIPKDERKTAVVLGGELGRVAGGDMLQAWLIEKAGGIYLAKDVSAERNWVNVGVETIFTWDPQYIFCTSSTVLDYRVEDLLLDPNWSAMQAIQNGQVHQLPAKIDSWDMPGLSCALGSMYMLHCMYPEHFSAKQLQQEIDEYYNFMFGQNFEAAYLGYALEP